MRDLVIPRHLAEAAASEARSAWLAELPGFVTDLARRWSLEVGDPYEPGGSTAWVAPVRDITGTALVLKVCWPHPEAAHEADGLRVWNGDGAVRLQDAVTLHDANALLLERCEPGTPLRDLPEVEQDTIVAGLLRRLWVVPPSDHPFASLALMCEQWADRFERRTSRPSDLDAGLEHEGMQLFRALPLTATSQVLLCTDLHAGNVLRSVREPWLTIDPKPYVGDPTYDALQHMLNCPTRLHADPRRFTREIAELLELDAERLLLWLFARCVVESPHWRGLADVAATDRAYVTEPGRHIPSGR